MSAGKKIVSFICLSILLTVCLGLFRPQKSYSEFSRDHFWTLKTHTSEKYGIVIYGDSRVYRGLAPEFVSSGTGLSCFNFGYSSGSMSQRMLDFADSHLDDTKTPVIVLGITPYSLTVDALKDQQFLQELNRSGYDKFQRMYIDPRLVFFDKIEPTDLFGMGTTLSEDHCTDGWVKTASPERNLSAGLESYKKSLSGNPIDQKAVDGLIRQIAAWGKQNITVIAYRPPTFDGMEALEDELTGFDENELASEIEAAGGFWLDLPNSGLVTYDGSHLTLESTIDVSQAINFRIKKLINR